MSKSTKAVNILGNAVLCIVSVLYVLASLTPYIHPEIWIGFTFLALGFPYLWWTILLTAFITFFINKKKGIALLLLSFLGWKNITSTVAINNTKPFNQQKQPKYFRLLSWNVDEFINSEFNCDTANNPRRKILKFIAESKADILCLQDFSTAQNKDYLSNITYIRDSLGYKYVLFTIDDKRFFTAPDDGYGTAIFSKYPFVDSGRIAYTWMKAPEHLNFVDVVLAKDTIRFYNTHLRSMSLKDINPDIAQNPFVAEDNNFITNKTVAGKIRAYDLIHAKQALFVKEHLSKTPHPYFFCADLNAVPSSYVYYHLKKGLEDAFLTHGMGYGSSYDGIAPTIRIDVVLHTPSVVTQQFYSPKLHLSDHFPSITDFTIR